METVKTSLAARGGSVERGEEGEHGGLFRAGNPLCDAAVVDT